MKGVLVEAVKESRPLVASEPGHKLDKIGEDVDIEAHRQLLKLRCVVHMAEVFHLDSVVDNDDTFCEGLGDIGVICRGLRLKLQCMNLVIDRSSWVIFVPYLYHHRNRPCYQGDEFRFPGEQF